MEHKGKSEKGSTISDMREDFKMKKARMDPEGERRIQEYYICVCVETDVIGELYNEREANARVRASLIDALNAHNIRFERIYLTSGVRDKKLYTGAWARIRITLEMTVLFDLVEAMKDIETNLKERQKRFGGIRDLGDMEIKRVWISTEPITFRVCR